MTVHNKSVKLFTDIKFEILWECSVYTEYLERFVVFLSKTLDITIYQH